jgi:hypothetical protein
MWRQFHNVKLRKFITLKIIRQKRDDDDDDDGDDDDRGWERGRDGIKRSANWVEGKAERRPIVPIVPPTRCREKNSQMDL